MTPGEIARIERSIADLKADLTKQIDDLRHDVAEAASFQKGFQSVTRTLTYILGIVVVAATVYGAVFR